MRCRLLATVESLSDRLQVADDLDRAHHGPDVLDRLGLGDQLAGLAECVAEELDGLLLPCPLEQLCLLLDKRRQLGVTPNPFHPTAECSLRDVVAGRYGLPVAHAHEL